MSHLLFKIGDFIMAALAIILNFLNGRFGRRVLINPYRVYWAFTMWGIAILLFFRFIAIPFFQWWDGVVALLNHVIWG